MMLVDRIDHNAGIIEPHKSSLNLAELLNRLGWQSVHPWFALVVLFAMLMFVLTVKGSESPHLRRCAFALIGLTVAQSLVGLGTWYVKYGVPSWGVVAQQDSIAQIVICSLHKVVGLLTLMTSVLAVFCSWSVKPLQGVQRDTMSVGHHVAGVAT